MARNWNTSNMFGLNKEIKIADSGVREVFTPHQPISQTDLLFGRQEEIRKLVETLNTPGQHVLLYGDRGVGKSSLANVAALVLSTMVERPLILKRCDSSDSFETIIQKPLAMVGEEFSLSEIQKTYGTGSTGSFGFLGTQFGASSSETDSATYTNPVRISPSYAAEKVSSIKALFLIDEADAISNPQDRKKLAELIKHLSDSPRAKLKIMVVGIAETGDELTAAHPSVQRCLKETRLARMADDELREIIVDGTNRVGISFSEKTISTIVGLSSGYPHFTHLLSLKCCEDAIIQDRNEVGLDDLKNSLESAVKDAEGTLKRVYDDSVRSTSPMYQEILIAASLLGGEEFTSEKWKNKIKERTGNSISQGSLNNYLKRLISKDGTGILQRLSKGVYRFNDPRMSSFIKIANHVV